MTSCKQRLTCLILCIAVLVSGLVMPVHAINSLMDIPVKKGAYMTLETNKQSLSYKSGDDVVMTVRLFDASGKQISAPYIRYNLRVDGSNEGGYGEYQLNWVTVPFRDGEYTIRTKAIDIPGFMRLRVDILDEDKNIINRKYAASSGDWSEFGPAGQLSFFQGGVVVDVENIRTTASGRTGEQVGDYEGATYDQYGVPSDFMDFWADTLAELDEEGNSPKLIELSEIPVSTYNNWYRYNHDLYEYKISCPGDETDLKSGDTFVSGVIQIPRGVDLRNAPIVMHYCGYGISNPAPVGSDSIKGKIAVTVGAHSLDYDYVTKVAHTGDDFNLHADQQGATNYYGFSFTENQSRDDIYFKYMLLRDVQAVRFATKAFREGGTVEFDASASEETKALAAEKLVPGLWDGENIMASGSSQGGFQAVAVAALYSETVNGADQRITELYAGIPWMCDVQGNTDSLKVQSTYRQEYEKNGVEADGLNYYDTANFGRFVGCDTVISAGMGDPLCPASGVSALYNNIRTNGKEINITLGFTQGRTHSTNDNSANHAEEKIYTVRSQQTVAGYTDPAGNFEASVADGVLTIRSLGDTKILTGTAEDSFVTYLADYKTSIKTVKIIGKFAELGDTQFMFEALDAVTTMLIDYRTDTIGAYNTTTYAGNFISMSKLVTLGHVEFDGADNIVTGSPYNTYEDGVCDLRGFDHVINHTGKSDFDSLPRSILRSTGVKKVIMPDSLMCNGTDVAGRLPTNGLSLCNSLTEVIVPADVRVFEMGKFFLWKDSGVRTVRFEGGVTADFAIGGKNTDTYPTADGITGATIYCPSQTDVAVVSAALSAADITDTCIKAAVFENDGFSVSGTVLTIPHNGDTGIASCDVTWYEAMNGITDVVIEDGYLYLGSGIFNMATVEKIYIPESVIEISPDCFGGETDFVIFGVEGSYAQTFANVNGIEFKTQAGLLNAITADGFNVRIKDYTGIRGLFTFSEKIEAENNALGYTLVEYGALACSGTRYAQYGYDAKAIFDGSATDAYLQKVVVVGENGVNRFVDPEKKQFCISVVGISEKNYCSDVYICGYQVWTDGESEYFIAAEYVPSSGEKHYTANLYELTVYGYKSGLVNSETMDDVCLWDVLETQAVTLDEFNEGEYTHGGKQYPVTSTAGYTLTDDGSFTFKNIPLLDYTGSAANNVGWNFVPTGLETESSTGIEWTLLPDGEDYVAVFRRAEGLADDFKALMPRQTNDENSKAYFAHLPIHESWGCLTSAKAGEYTINSPRLLAEQVAKIRTVVLDYGIDGHEAAGLGFITSALTVVYPNNYTNVADYGFNGCKQLKNVIWANDATPHGKDVEGIPDGEGLLDLRGMRELKTTRFIYGCSAVENIVFSTLNSSEARINSLFMNASKVKRGWISNAASNAGIEKAPAENVIDMRAATNVRTLTAGAFEMGSVIRSIYLPATITTISENKSSYGYNMAFGNGYAHRIYTEQEDFKTVLSKYYTYVKANFTGNAANALDKLIINDTPIAQYLGN